MHRIWDDLRNHRLGAALFMAWWLALMLLNFIVSRRTQESVGQLHCVTPVIAGALVCWWRRFRPERITGGTVAGATVLVLNFALMLPRELADALARGKGPLEALKVLVDVEVLALAAFSCVLGAVLGFLGALGTLGLVHLEKVLQREAPDSQSLSQSPIAPATEPPDKASAITRRIMARRTLAVAGGFVILATIVLASGTFGRAVPPPLIIVNLLVAVVLLAPLSRWSGDAGRALALIAGLVSFSLGSAVLVGAGFTWAERSATLSIALSLCALVELGAGILALVATSRKPEAHYAS